MTTTTQAFALIAFGVLVILASISWYLVVGALAGAAGATIAGHYTTRAAERRSRQ